jgi:hypothetical protein
VKEFKANGVLPCQNICISRGFKKPLFLTIIIHNDPFLPRALTTQYKSAAIITFQSEVVSPRGQDPEPAHKPHHRNSGLRRD